MHEEESFHYPEKEISPKTQSPGYFKILRGFLYSEPSNPVCHLVQGINEQVSVSAFVNTVFN